MRGARLAVFVFICFNSIGRCFWLCFDIAFIIGGSRLSVSVGFCVSFGFLGNLPVPAGGPQSDLGLGHIRVDEVTAAVAGAVIGGVTLRGHPTNVRIDIGREGVSTPLPADTEEHGRGRSPLGKCDDNCHGIGYDEMLSREIRAGPTPVLKGHNGSASFQYALRLGCHPRFG